MRRFTLLTVALCSAVAFLVGIILAGGVTRTPVVSSAPRPGPTRPGLKAAADGAGAVNFADVAEKINPAVVNIDAASRGGRDARRRRGIDDQSDIPREFDLPHQGSGSGFIIDKDGYVLTN